ncbi:MAG: isoaspartyl peptidase/L-asparaginase [Candidatus Poseidonia sp.]|nr:isoaspartyl peptidase/L-asparaginase [Poseidonia sp.]
MVLLAVHGGAGGDGAWRGMTDADPQRLRCMFVLLERLGAQLADGSLDALEAVTLAVEAMEDEALFNAGRGSVLDAEGRITMDASVMRGTDRAAGSVVALTQSRHPVRVAHHLLQQGWPVMLVGQAADDFGGAAGVEQVGNDWLKTELRQAQWQKWRDAKLHPGATDEDDALLDHDGEEDGWGTVGAVALDANGQLAAATSTGGMTGKPLGRVGDTPIIGAGTWADDRVAVSCTGVGEAFIRTAAAHTTAVNHRTMSLQEASKRVLDDVAPLGGRGGLIAVSAQGEVVVPFQTMLMYRGVYRDGVVSVGIGPDMEEGFRP